MQNSKTFPTALFSLVFALVLTASASNAQTAGAAILARDEPAEGAASGKGVATGAFGGGGKVATGSAGRTTSKTRSTKTSGAKTTAKATATAKPRPWDGFVVGDKYTFL